MAYEIHIRRQDAKGIRVPIPLDAWLSVIDEVASVRRATGDTEIRNPATGEVLRFLNSGGDAEVYDAVRKVWERALYWQSPGHISFRAPDGFVQPDHSMRAIVRTLSQSLGAVVIGDEGETYC